MFVLFVFNRVVSFFQYFLLRAAQRLAADTDEVPVHVVFCLRLDHTFGGNNLGSFSPGGLQSDLHGLYQRHPGMADYAASGRVLIGIQPQLCQNLGDDTHVVPGLFQILFPLLNKVVVERAAQRGFVNEYAALFCFKGLIQQRMQRVLLQRF